MYICWRFKITCYTLLAARPRFECAQPAQREQESRQLFFIWLGRKLFAFLSRAAAAAQITTQRASLLYYVCVCCEADNQLVAQRTRKSTEMYFYCLCDQNSAFEALFRQLSKMRQKNNYSSAFKINYKIYFNCVFT